MPSLIVLVIVGFIAQLIDGSLGMAYGVSSTSLLLAYGIAPASASASVHLAEMGTTAVSGLSHWKLGNVDWRVVRNIALPGFIGAMLGAFGLTMLSAATARPWVSVFLGVLGFVVLARFAFGALHRRARRPLPAWFLRPLGLVAGFLDAAGGGGWGPIATPSLLSTGAMEPRKVVGSVDTSEFLVALGASIGFFAGLTLSAVDFAWVGALLIGGIVAAPLAAMLVRWLPARILGTTAGTMIIFLNVRTVADTLGFQGPALTALYAALAVLGAVAMASAVMRLRSDREHHEQATT